MRMCPQSEKKKQTKESGRTPQKKNKQKTPKKQKKNAAYRLIYGSQQTGTKTLGSTK